MSQIMLVKYFTYFCHWKKYLAVAWSQAWMSMLDSEPRTNDCCCCKLGRRSVGDDGTRPPLFSYDKFRCQNVGFVRSTQHGRRPYVDIILICTSHQAHYRLLIFVCSATPWIAAWSPWWIFISPTAEPADSCTLCNLIPFEWRQISLPKGGIGKSYTGTPVISTCRHSMNQASSVGSKVYPPNVQWLGRAMAPLQI